MLSEIDEAPRTSPVNNWLGLHIRKRGEKVKEYALEFSIFTGKKKKK